MLARWSARTAALALAVAGAGCAAGAGDRPPGLPRLAPVAVAGSTAPGIAAGSGAAGDLRQVTTVVRRFFRALDRLRRSMSTGPLAALMTADCPCRALLRAIRSARRRGERYADHVRLVALVPHLDAPDRADAVVSYDVDHGGLVTASGRQVAPLRNVFGVHRLLMLRRTGGRWLIDRMVAT